MDGHQGCAWDSLGFPSVSTTSHSTVGWDGHMGFGVLCMGQLGIPHCVHYFPWYSGMGWTLGIGVLCMGQLGIPTVCPLLPTVQWDGMDTWDWGYCAWDSLGFSSVSITSHGTVGWDGPQSSRLNCRSRLVRSHGNNVCDVIIAHVISVDTHMHIQTRKPQSNLKTSRPRAKRAAGW